MGGSPISPKPLSSDVCASVMEVQIKLYVSVMTDEATEAPQKNSMILKLNSKLPKHRGGGGWV